jgi:branched-subunit amino acid transport protein AzlD
MSLTSMQTFIIIAMVAIGTMATRFLPFVLLKGEKSKHASITYLGEVLPYSAIGLLVVYCLKDVGFTAGSRGLPETISILLIVFLHKWKGNVLLSIGMGTFAYMVLVQLIFN